MSQSKTPHAEPGSPWLSVECPACGARVDEQCFETDRFYGKTETKDGQEHQERIRLVLRRHQ